MPVLVDQQIQVIINLNTILIISGNISKKEENRLNNNQKIRIMFHLLKRKIIVVLVHSLL